MALMPVICWRTARTTAMKSARRKPGRKSSAKDPFSRRSVSRCPDLRRRGRRVVDPGEDAEGFRVAILLDQPARAFGNPQKQEKKGHRGQRPHPEHPAPIRGSGSGERPVDEVGDEDAADDGHLIDGDERPPHPGRGNLGDVERRQDGGRAYPQTADEAEDNELENVLREGAAESGDEEQDRRNEHELLASDPVADRTRQTGPEHAADEHDTHGPTFLERGQGELILEIAGGAGDDGRVEPKRKPPMAAIRLRR
jgi:hypothetical protein